MVVLHLNAEMFFLPLSHIFSIRHPQRQDFDLSLVWFGLKKQLILSYTTSGV